MSFIATLSANDDDMELRGPGPEVVPFGNGASDHHSGDWQAAVGFRTAEVTPDGHSLLFMSGQSLTNYDNEDAGTGLDEMFLYEADSSELRCVSCNPSGEAPVTTEFNTYPGLDQGIGGFFPISQSATYQPQVISDDGGRVFFDSGEPLVPQDTNGWLDVYEWERPASPAESTNFCARSSLQF